MSVVCDPVICVESLHALLAGPVLKAGLSPWRNNFNSCTICEIGLETRHFDLMICLVNSTSHLILAWENESTLGPRSSDNKCLVVITNFFDDYDFRYYAVSTITSFDENASKNLAQTSNAS